MDLKYLYFAKFSQLTTTQGTFVTLHVKKKAVKSLVLDVEYRSLQATMVTKYTLLKTGNPGLNRKSGHF